MRSFITEKVKAHAHTAHTSNLVPLIYIGRQAETVPNINASLCDIAPTMLHLMGLDIPAEMTGHPLFRLADLPAQAAAGE